jgi:prepilin-type N-terminal cleavage/methylation domain-containing protein
MNRKKRVRQKGFTLIELMVALLLMTIIGGAVFEQIGEAQRRSAVEETRLDIFQESRDFMDQMTRDLHQAGYPNVHNFAGSTVSVDNLGRPTDTRVAVGLVKLNYDELMFEGDLDGTGVVSSVQYKISATGDGCPCLRRSQIPKTSTDPMNPGTPVYWTEVQYVQNGTSGSPIFYAYDTHNNLVTLPTGGVTYSGNAATMATISTIKVVLTAQSPHFDLRSGQKPSVTLTSTVKINNCSSAAPGQTMSCQ